MIRKSLVAKCSRPSALKNHRCRAYHASGSTIKMQAFVQIHLRILDLSGLMNPCPQRWVTQMINHRD